MKLEEIIKEPGNKSQAEAQTGAEVEVETDVKKVKELTASYYEILGLNSENDYKFSDIKKAYDTMKKKLNSQYRLAGSVEERTSIVEEVKKVKEAYKNLHVTLPAKLTKSVKGFIKGKQESIEFNGILLQDKIEQIRTSREIDKKLKQDEKKKKEAQEDEERTKAEVAENVEKMKRQKELYAVLGLTPDASMKEVDDAATKLYKNTSFITDNDERELQEKINKKVSSAYAEIRKQKKGNSNVKKILKGTAVAVAAISLISLGTIGCQKIATNNKDNSKSNSDTANEDDYKTIPAGLNFNPNNIETMTNKASRLMEAAGAAGIKLDAEQAFDILVSLNIKHISVEALAKTGYTFDKDKLVDTFQNFGLDIANDIATATDETKFDLSPFIADSSSSKFVKDSTDKLTAIKKEDIASVRKYLEDTFVVDYNRKIESSTNLVVLYMALGQGVYTNSSQSPLLDQDLFNKLLGVVKTCGDIKNSSAEVETAFNYHATNLKEALENFQTKYIAYISVNKEYVTDNMIAIIDAINKDANVVFVANPSNEQQQKDINAAAGITDENTKPSVTNVQTDPNTGEQYVTDGKTLTQAEMDAAKAAEEQKIAAENAATEQNAKDNLAKQQAAINAGFNDAKVGKPSNPSQYPGYEKDYNDGYNSYVPDVVVEETKTQQSDSGSTSQQQSDSTSTSQQQSNSGSTSSTTVEIVPVPGLNPDGTIQDGWHWENGVIVQDSVKTK